MKVIFVCLFLLIFTCFGCKTNQMKDKLREGLWIEKEVINEKQYKSKGRYHKGFEIKTWKYFENGKCIKKEQYKDRICLTTFYQNGRKKLQGYTKMVVTDTEMHWFYFGNWYEFDEKGTPIVLKTYENGELKSETKIN